DSFYAFIEYLGVPPSAPQWQLPLSEADQEFARQQLQQRATVVICPAASKDERNWLPERYAAFADYVVNQGFQVVVCGSPAAREVQLAAQIEAAMQQQALNLVGQTSLKQLAAVLQQAVLV